MEDGGFVLIGNSDLNGNNDIVVVRTDETGQLEWARLLGEGDDDSAVRVLVTTDGKVIALSNSNGYDIP